MTMRGAGSETLEARIDRLLRAQPVQSAPRDLVEVVYARLEQRHALPWWRQSYRAWPVSMRVLFLIASVLAAWLPHLLSATNSPAAALAHLATLHVTDPMWLRSVVWWFEWFAALSHVLSGAMAALPRIPMFWIYGGLALLAACYATLTGFLAVLFRTTHRPT